MNELENQVRVVAEARARADRMADRKRVSYQVWEAQNRIGLDELIAAEQEVKDNEVKLRNLTLQAYAETGNKTPAVGVGIREVTKLEYDKKVAFDWAKHHEMALQLDKKAFEKIVKASDSLDFTFVKTTLEPQATIASDLSEYLK